MSIIRIAKAAGVSTATVSRVINGLPSVSKEKAAHVRKIIDKMKYDPAEPASRQGPKKYFQPPLRHKSVAFVIIGKSSRVEHMTATTLLLEGASLALQKHGISMTVDYMLEPERLPRNLEMGKTDGLLILGGHELSPAVIGRMQEFPAVRLFFHGVNYWNDRIQPDHRMVGSKVYDYMIENNCPGVCCMSFKPRSKFNDFWVERAEAFRFQCEKEGLPCTNLLAEFPEDGSLDRQYEIAGQLVERYLKLSPKPKGLFVTPNELGLYVHAHLCRNRITPMKDLLMVGGDMEFYTPQTIPKPVMIDIRAKEIGRLAVELLLMRMSNPDAPKTVQFVEPNLVMPSE